jgi:GPH family glycoside/pentoside/hexuronide:cation symporter
MAFVALPLYVQLPAHYAQVFGVSLSAMGALLLGARAVDALVDPWLGSRVDSWMQRGLWPLMAGAGAMIGLGFVALFLPPFEGRSEQAWLAWCGAALVPTYLAFSLSSIAHQGWGARLGGSAGQQARIVAWREGFGLAGVLAASVLPTWLGWQATAAVLIASLLLAGGLLRRAPPPLAPRPADTNSPTRPWQHRPFTRLLGVFALNGIASAVPATLVLFFVADRLQAPSWAPVFLLSYFLAAALALPGWVRLVARFGLVRSWALGMVVAILSFIGAGALGAGDTGPFLLVCLASGVALGADLALPSALLAQVLRDQPDTGRYFGWWNCVSKLNLALAAGLALPLLEWGGYAPGVRTPQALQTLSSAYALLPCLLKLMALAALLRWAPVTPSKEA